MTIDPLSHRSLVEGHSHTNGKASPKDVKNTEKAAKIAQNTVMNTSNGEHTEKLTQADVKFSNDVLKEREEYIQLFIKTRGMPREQAEAFVDTFY